jgi:hypothetical protein
MIRFALTFAIVALIALICPTGFSAHAQTPISNATSEAFYGNCLKRRDPRMSEESQTEFCACSATQMQQSMTMEEAQTMFQQSQEGRDMLNKMLVTVYAPCMDMPVQDIVELECRSDPKVKALNLKGNPSDLCYCMGKETGKWFAANGPYLIAALLKKDPNITDPITPIMESHVLKKESFQFLMQCANGN